MSHFWRLVLTIAVIFASLSGGYLYRRLAEKREGASAMENTGALRLRLQTAAIFFFMPFSAMLSLWGLPKPEIALLSLPFLGLVSFVCGGGLALLGARALKLDRRATGSFYCCGSFTNIGAVGSLVCLVFLGENTIALVALYRLFEELYYFSVSFPVAKWYGSAAEGAKLGLGSFKFSPVLGIIVFALLLGICLNLLGIGRPAGCGAVASASMFAGTVFFLFAIGLTLKFSSIGRYLPECGIMCAIKFVGVPAVVVGLAKCFGLGTIENGLPLQVATVLASMPVAMTALVPPSLFRLDVDLANACWIVSTGALAVVLPILTLVLPKL